MIFNFVVVKYSFTKKMLIITHIARWTVSTAAVVEEK